MLEQRKQEEQDFHSRVEADRRRLSSEAFHKKHSNTKYYSVTRKSTRELKAWLRINCPGSVALDYACGRGEQAVAIAKLEAKCFAMDISEGLYPCSGGRGDGGG